VSDGRTIWMPKDTGWWRREHVVELGEEFGPVGPAVLDWLSCEAKLQNDGGNVKAGPRTLARGVFSDLVTVRNVLSRAVTIGALHHFEEHDGRFTCTISGWSSDNQRGWNAFRQADYRAKNAEEVTERNALSRPVAPREEEKRKEKDNNSEHPDFGAWLKHHEQTTGRKPPKAGTQARQAIASMFAARRSEGYELAQLCGATLGAFNDEWRRENGHYGHESVLRPTKIHELIEKGRTTRARPPSKNQRAGKVTLLGAVQRCRSCESEISNLQANNQSRMCDGCYEAMVTEQGAA
jgi:hypothetical protein